MRFPGFEGEWDIVHLGDLCDKIGDGIHSTPKYNDFGDYSFINGNNFVEGKIVISESTKRVTKAEAEKHNAHTLTENTILLSINGTIGSLALYNGESVMLGKSACYINPPKTQNRLFIFYQLSANRINNYFISELTGSTIKNLSLKSIRNTILYLPANKEQKKIAKFFSFLDKRISTQSKIIEDLKLLKSTLRHNIFTDLDNSNVEIKLIKDVLNYEQPTNYIISNTNYQNDPILIPVLTANKAFILGYTSDKDGIYNKGNCIIFDDFTMDLKYVDFPFKVKSSAIKILTPRPKVSLKYIFEYLSFLNLVSSNHKRHYISEVESMPISVPKLYMQNIFANLFSAVDKKIESESNYHNLLLLQKQYLLNHIFI